MQLKKNGHDARYQQPNDDDTDLSAPESADIFAELAPSQKNAISHRGRAVAEARQVLQEMLGERERRTA